MLDLQYEVTMVAKTVSPTVHELDERVEALTPRVGGPAREVRGALGPPVLQGSEELLQIPQSRRPRSFHPSLQPPDRVIHPRPIDLQELLLQLVHPPK